MVDRHPGLRNVLASQAMSAFPSDAATILSQQDPDDVAAFLGEQPAELTTRVLEKMQPDVAADIVSNFTDATFKAVIPLVNPTNTVRWLARFDGDERATRMGSLPESLARELESLLSYPPGTAGSLMDPRFTTARLQSTVGDALNRLRQVQRRGAHQLLVIDDEGKFVGAVPLSELAVADPETLISTIMRESVSVPDTAARSEVLEVLQQQGLPSIPVVDFHGKLIGVIRHDALVRAAASQATTNVQTMVGVSADEGALSSIPFAVRKRLPWLQVNLATAFLAAFVVGLFEGTIARFTALALLMPVAAGQSGNTGAQALAVTMRGLSLREIRVRQWYKVLAKEFGVGAINGVAVATVTSLAVLLWSGSTGLATVIGLAMVISMVIASAAGALVPIVLTVFKQDPAAASSIILTTITDIVGFMSFLGLATIMSGLL